MQWIRRNKKRFWLMEVVALLAAAATFLVFPHSESIQLERWQLGLLILPWAGAFGAALPLTYLSWFGESPSTGSGIKVLKVFFWLMAFVAVAIITSIYASFVF